MTVSDAILDVLSKYVYGHIRVCFHSFDQIRKIFPRLSSCNFDAFVNNRFRQKGYLQLYSAFMHLFCAEIREQKLYDKIENCWMSVIRVPDSSRPALILETYYYFKLVFPAALFFFSNPVYDSRTANAKRLILKKYSLLLKTSTSDKCVSTHNQYDLCDGWKSKTKYIRGQISKLCLSSFNIANNQKLSEDPRSRRTYEISVVNYKDVEHIATVIYENYSHLVSKRKFIICTERMAFSKYNGLFKLKFVAPHGARTFFNTVKIEKHVPLYFLFDRARDLVALTEVHNAYVRQGKCLGCTEVSIPTMKYTTLIPIQSMDKYFQHLSSVKCVRLQRKHCNHVLSIRNLRDYVEKTGFVSVYDLKDYSTLAYVKNRVIHLTTMFKRPLYCRPFYEKKGKKLVKIEKMVRTMTMTRYKTDHNVSFNVNYQGPLSTIQLAMCRFLNENIELDCRIVKPLWVSNVCTTLDTVHSGILNTHVYRKKCLRNTFNCSFPMMNFPAVVTLLGDTDNTKTQSVINNRTSLNTCRMYGDELKTSVVKCINLIKECSELDENLTRILYQIEYHAKELLPRNVILLVHLLYLHKEDHGYGNDDIVQFFQKKMLCSRMLTTSNRAFTTYNLYCKKYKSDAIDNCSVKSVKRFDVQPPTIDRQELYDEFQKRFRDVGTLNDKMFRQRGRNANLIDLILNSKDEFFLSTRCSKLLTLLQNKFSCHPYTRVSLKLIQAYREYKNGNV